MPPAEERTLTLPARAAELARVLEATSVTDAAGNGIELETALVGTVNLLGELRSNRAGLFLAGNGGSAAVAGHSAVDFLNVGKLRATTLHESSMMTCMANDYGYENAFARMITMMAQPGDLLIAISSSGKSANILNAASQMRELGGKVLTLSGFAADNPLRSRGDINFWLDSVDYGMVEIGHQFVLHNVSDRLLKEKTR